MHNWNNSMTKAKSNTKKSVKGRARAKAKALAKAKAKKPVFTKDNLYQPPGFCVELREALSAISISEAAMLAEILGVQKQDLKTEAGINMDIQDIECYEGGVKDAKDSFYYWFQAGPAKTIGDKTNEYTLLKGNVLSWLLDCIMFRMSYDGYKVLHDLAIPL